MTKTVMNSDRRATSARTLHTPTLPRLPERISRLVIAAYAAHGGAENMTFDEWRGVEEDLKRKLRKLASRGSRPRGHGSLAPDLDRADEAPPAKDLFAEGVKNGLWRQQVFKAIVE